MTHPLDQAPDLGPVGDSTTDYEEPEKAADLVEQAARLLDPSIMPGAPPDLAKISLADMAYWLMDFRLKARFRSGPMEGRDADFAVVGITPHDAAMMERIVDSLNYLDRQRAKEKSAKERAKSNGWGRR